MARLGAARFVGGCGQAWSAGFVGRRGRDRGGMARRAARPGKAGQGSSIGMCAHSRLYTTILRNLVEPIPVEAILHLFFRFKMPRDLLKKPGYFQGRLRVCDTQSRGMK